MALAAGLIAAAAVVMVRGILPGIGAWLSPAVVAILGFVAVLVTLLQGRGGEEK